VAFAPAELEPTFMTFSESLHPARPAGGGPDIMKEHMVEVPEVRLRESRSMWIRTQALTTFVLLFVGGCLGDALTGPVDPEDLSYAPALGVDLTQMTRTGTGLYLQDEVVGDGPEALAGATVTVHYTGWFPDGFQFDSSLNPGRTPFTFGPLGTANVIAGWNEGVQGMREGGHRLLVIPYQLAYGPTGTSGIPPYETLVFRIELLSAGAN